MILILILGNPNLQITIMPPQGVARQRSK